MSEPMRDVIIIGGGPAGLTAGLYAARAGLNALLLERLMAGGQVALTSRVENYPGFPEGVDGPDLCMKMEEQAVRAGLELRYEGALEIDCAAKRVRADEGWLEAKHLILALGAQARKLNVPGEEKLTGRGVGYCATCDGALYRDGRVAVVGGGNAAVEEALYLAGIAKEVTLIHRRDTLRAEQALVNRALEHPRITILWNSEVERLEGEAKLTAIVLKDGRELPMDGLFVAIGRVPQTELVKGQLSLNEQGFILADESCKTSLPGVFVAGDARAKALRQVVTAVADGAVAAAGCE
ncbi:MAG: thioredoxin-disulfide reductase [Oscillospiraceae bacterium]|jgi:thioredoxin reductase (NADPH)|nr:thioredoxin-disulfide reductase [Oscillospiraceae bacterium]